MHLAIDLDNTIFWYDPKMEEEFGPLVPGADVAIRKLKKAGHMILIWTCRLNASRYTESEVLDQRNKIATALMASGVPFDQLVVGERGKVLADFYIDDRAIGVPIRLWKGKAVVDWQQAYKLVLLRGVAERIGRVRRERKPRDSKATPVSDSSDQP
jgi:hypothetical protein